MRLSGGRHFSYCMNVHPGEGLEDQLTALRGPAADVKAALSPDAPFGLGLRIAARAAEELQSPASLEQLRDALAAADCYAFSVNAFPYGNFHRGRVKEQVYLPDWSSPERLRYTREVCRLLAALLPEGVTGSVSTVPLGYKTADRPGDAAIRFRNSLCELAEFLHRLEDESGRRVQVGLEPEPDCLLETTAETLAFFESLFRAAGSAEDVVRRHIGVCFDTCHVAMQFEDPSESLAAYQRAGIPLTKVQISAALECGAEIDPDRLRAFDDGVYLHQVKSAGGRSWADLPDWLRAPGPVADLLRIHAHVPLHWPGEGPLQSTRPTLDLQFRDALRASNCRHFEVETYTFNVLPGEVRGGQNLAEDLIAECRWALDHLMN